MYGRWDIYVYFVSTIWFYYLELAPTPTSFISYRIIAKNDEYGYCLKGL